MPPRAKSTKTIERLRRALPILCWLYAAGLLALWILLWSAGDRWWLATLLLFGCRWMWALPLVVLLPAMLIVCPRKSWILLLAAEILFVQVMGFNIPVQSFLLRPIARVFAKVFQNENQGSIQNQNQSLRLRVLTCNTHREELDAQALRVEIALAHPDIVALQEFDLARRPSLFADPGWHVLLDGELCLASRHPLKKIRDLFEATPDGGRAACYAIQTQNGALYFINLHLASPHQSFDAVVNTSPQAEGLVQTNIAARRAQAAAVSDFAAHSTLPILLAGDFNTPVDGALYRQFWSPFENACAAAGWGFGYTYYYDWRSQIRIDHILGGQNWHCERAWIGGDVGSKHRPVIADMRWEAARQPTAAPGASGIAAHPSPTSPNADPASARGR